MFGRTKCPGLWRWLASLAVVLAAAAEPALASPPWLVRAWQSDEGLPDNTVMGIDQTPDGFLWVATSTGLARFDGVQFRPFPVTPAGSPAGRIKALLARNHSFGVEQEHAEITEKRTCGGLMWASANGQKMSLWCYKTSLTHREELCGDVKRAVSRPERTRTKPLVILA